ncbi:MAG: membrane dipeptidase [Clostridia bacterium]|nr:membrane dipeptidase [Clostridia bacterium]
MQICDAHNDMLMNLNSIDEINKYLNKYCYNNKVVNIFTAYYVSQSEEKKLSANEILEKIKYKFALLKNFNCLTPTLENIGFINNEETLEQVIKLKPFCATLTWNYDNNLAGGAYGESGLTSWGREVVAQLEANGIVVDIAHLNKRTFLEFSKITKYPIFCSHTSSRDVYNIPRALDSEQLEIIKSTNGYVGLCLYSTLLGDRKADLTEILKHFSALIKILGKNCLGLGTDFNATGECNPIDFDIDYNGVPYLLNEIINKYGRKTAEQFAGKNLKDFIRKIK